jgi:hypothetical protein
MLTSSNVRSPTELPESLNIGTRIAIAALVLAAIGIIITMLILFWRPAYHTDTDTGRTRSKVKFTNIMRIDTAAVVAPIRLTYRVNFSEPCVGTTLDLRNGVTDGMAVTFGTVLFDGNYAIFTVSIQTEGEFLPVVGKNHDVKAVSTGLSADAELYKDPDLDVLHIFKINTPFPLTLNRTDTGLSNTNVTMHYKLTWSQPVTVTRLLLTNMGTSTDTIISMSKTQGAVTTFTVTPKNVGTVTIVMVGSLSNVRSVTSVVAMPPTANIVADVQTIDHSRPLPISLVRTDSNSLEMGVVLQYALLWSEAVEILDLTIENVIGRAPNVVISDISTVGAITTFKATCHTSGIVQLFMPAKTSTVISAITSTPMDASSMVISNELIIPAGPPRFISLVRMNPKVVSLKGARLYYKLRFNEPVIINQLNWHATVTQIGQESLTFDNLSDEGTFYIMRVIVDGTGNTNVQIGAGNNVVSVASNMAMKLSETVHSNFEQEFFVPRVFPYVVVNTELYTDPSNNFSCIVAQDSSVAGAVVVATQTPSGSVNLCRSTNVYEILFSEVGALTSAGRPEHGFGPVLVENANHTAMAVLYGGGPSVAQASTVRSISADHGRTWAPTTTVAASGTVAPVGALISPGNQYRGPLQDTTGALVIANAINLGGGTWVGGARIDGAKASMQASCSGDLNSQRVLVVYQASVNFKAVSLVESTDGGQSWANPVSIWAGNGTDVGASVCVVDGYVYICWVDSTAGGLTWTRSTTRNKAIAFETAQTITFLSASITINSFASIQMFAWALPCIVVFNVGLREMIVASMTAIDDLDITNVAFHKQTEKISLSGDLTSGWGAFDQQNLYLPFRTYTENVGQMNLIGIRGVNPNVF